MINSIEIREPINEKEITDISLFWLTVFKSLANLDDDNPDRWFKVDTWAVDSIQAFEENKSGVLNISAFENGKVLGAIAGYQLRASDSLFYLDTIAVDPESRKMGLGIKLLEKLISVCTEKKIKTILFDTNKLNKFSGAVNFWDHLAKNYHGIKIEKLGEKNGYFDGSEDTGGIGVFYTIQLKGVTW